MNFLAHLYLSGNDPPVLVGNFIGDFVKGRLALQKFEPAIVRGIKLHRAIDAFTDSHEIVMQSKNRLRTKYRHYSGVIVDVFYDHFLAKNWNNYHHESLPDFAKKAYRSIESFDPILPRDVKYMLPYMTKGNWLVSYAHEEGIHRALSGMANRTPFVSKMEEAVADLIKDYESFKGEFDTFFPALQKHCEELIQL